ncbi:ankyrin repeat-containing domain protein, partial [Obelidium mucronatum]
MQTPPIFRCPNEIRHAILFYLPIDPMILRTVIFASKSLFAQLLHNNTKFARLHILFQYSTFQPTCTDLWEYLDTEQLRGDKWLALPFSYKVSLYRQILSEPNWKQVFQVTDLTLNLMCYSRWRMPNETALRIINQLLSEGLPIQSQENRAFRWAARTGYYEVVKLLIGHPDVDPTDQKHYAIASTPDLEYVDVVKLLLADPRIDPTAQQNLCMRWACDHEHWETVDLLLADERVDPSANDNYLVLSLLNKKRLGLVKELLELGRVDPAVGENSVIRTAADCGHTEIVDMLLKDPRVDPAAEDSSALALAAASGRIETVKLLLKDGRSDPASFQNHGIRNAASKGHWEVVQILLAEPGVNPAAENNAAIKSSVSNGHAKVVELLVKDSRVDLHPPGFNSIVVACGRGFADVLRALLWKPCNDEYLRQGLKRAVDKGFTEVVKVLLDYRIETPPFSLLMSAMSLESDEMFRLLLDALAKAESRLKQSRGRSLLQVAFSNNEAGLVSLLMSRIFGVDVAPLSREEARAAVEACLQNSSSL